MSSRNGLAQPDDNRPRQPVPMADQIAALRRWQMDHNGRPLADDESARKLAHGIDTLYVTMEVDWTPGENGSDPELWRLIEEAQLKARGEHPEQEGTRDEGVWCDDGILAVLPCLTGYGDLYVNVMPSGSAKGG